MEWLFWSSFIITPVATGVIAVFAIFNYLLLRQMKRANDQRDQEDKEFRQQVTDLYEAIVISNIVGPNPGLVDVSKSIDHFKENYKGDVPLFEKE